MPTYGYHLAVKLTASLLIEILTSVECIEMSEEVEVARREAKVMLLHACSPVTSPPNARFHHCSANENTAFSTVIYPQYFTVVERAQRSDAPFQFAQPKP